MNETPKPPLEQENRDILRHRAQAAPLVDDKTISGIAKLCAKAFTAPEACQLFGLKPRQWFDWKSRRDHAQKFAGLLEKIRADRIYAFVAGI